MDGFPNKPKILKGAFVEFGISLPPLFVVFQFNPEQLSRSRSVNFYAAGGEEECQATSGSEDGDTTGAACISRGRSLRQFHKENDDLLEIGKGQRADIQEESISFDIRLDATEDMSEGNVIAGEFGILPRLSTLEAMMHAKSDSLLGNLVDLLGGGGGFKFAGSENPPIVLFIWGYTRVLPVNLESMSITETEFNTHLAPTRASVNVSMKVIEGKNIPYSYSKLAKEAMSILNLANITDLANVVVPG